MSTRICLTLAALFGFCAVLLGAFGAHGLSGRDSRPGFLERKYADTPPKTVAGMEQPASYKYLQDFQTGVRYQMWHSLALFGVGLLMQQVSSKLLSSAAWCFAGGIMLFSGALLYFLFLLLRCVSRMCPEDLCSVMCCVGVRVVVVVVVFVVAVCVCVCQDVCVCVCLLFVLRVVLRRVVPGMRCVVLFRRVF